MEGQTATPTRCIHTNLPSCASCALSGYTSVTEVRGGETGGRMKHFGQALPLPPKAAPMQFKGEGQFFDVIHPSLWMDRERGMRYLLSHSSCKKVFLSNHDLCVLRQRQCVASGFRTLHCHYFLCLSPESSMFDL